MWSGFNRLTELVAGSCINDNDILLYSRKDIFLTPWFYCQSKSISELVTTAFEVSQRNYSGLLNGQILNVNACVSQVVGCTLDTPRTFSFWSSATWNQVVSYFLRSSCILSFLPSLLQATVVGNVSFLYSSILAFT